MWQVEEGPQAALNIFIEVLNGLAYAHRNGIKHRDIKPANIMLCTTNGATQLKILDFGISKLISSDANKLHSMTKGIENFKKSYPPGQVKVFFSIQALDASSLKGESPAYWIK